MAGLRRLPICILSIHYTVLHSASDTVWYTEKPGAYVPHVFILRSVAVVINIAHTGILCDHVPDFNIDFRLRYKSGVPHFTARLSL